MIKSLYISIALIGLTTISQINGQTNSSKQINFNCMNSFELSPETAHPKAKEILTEDFYWSTVDEIGPFGSDDGFDTFYGFLEWRKANNKKSPIIFLEKLIKEWEYPAFDWYTLDSTKIEEYILGNNQIDNSLIEAQIPAMKEHFKEMATREGKEFDEALFNQMFAAVSGDMGATYLSGIDNAIIAVGFGQLIIEGEIDKELKKITMIALQREQTPILLNKWLDFKEERVTIINRMISDLNKI